MASIAKFLLSVRFTIIELFIFLIFAVLLVACAEYIPIVSNIMSMIGSFIKEIINAIQEAIGLTTDSTVTTLVIFFVGAYYLDKKIGPKWEPFKEKFIKNALKSFSKD